MNVGLAEWIRLRAVWLLVIPFLWYARPSPGLLASGGALAALGLSLRAWAAGVLLKQKELSIGGPYAYTRNPLYLGSLLLGLGATIAGGRWAFVVLFLLFFVAVYRPTMRREQRALEQRFEERFRRYASRVPGFVPWARPYRPTDAASERSAFSVARYIANREYQALLGASAAFALLTAKLFWA